MEYRPLINPSGQKLRILGFCSGSGKTLWKTLEVQKEMEKTPDGCPFEIVACFVDSVDAGAIDSAKQFGVPFEVLDIRAYYKERNQPLKNRELRKQYDAEVLNKIEKYHADLVMLAGYVWAITDKIVETYMVVNVHPGDLSLKSPDGKRLLAGSNGIKAAFRNNLPELRASSHLATKEIDGGPLLIRSPKVPVDYTLHQDEDERFRYYLKMVNQQSRLVGARTILEIASGNFTLDQNNHLYYKGEPIPDGLSIENWDENTPIYKRDIEKLIAPRSVAVIGASVRPNIGHAVVRNIIKQGFTGPIYAINFHGDDVLQAKGYKSVKDIPGELDLAVICVPSVAVLDVVKDCGEKGVKGLICVSAGFREVGGDGIDREKELLELVNRYNMRLVGPNCMGVANTAKNVNFGATILSVTPPNGDVAFLSQSGALCASFIDFAEKLKIGFSVIVSLGNMADTKPSDFLALLEKDENTKVICMYLETLAHPVEFERAMSRVTKPVIIVKSGRTAKGAAAAGSHTGSLSGSDEVADAFLRKCGAIRVDTLEDAFYLASALSKMPRIKGNNIGIISNAGGLGTLTTDTLSNYGFALPDLNNEDRVQLAKKLLAEASTHNPLDLVATAPPEQYGIAAKAMKDSGKYDALVFECIPPATVDTQEVAKALIAQKDEDFPIFACFLGPKMGSAGTMELMNAGIPCFDFPDEMVRVMNYMRVANGNECTHIYENVSKENQRKVNTIIERCKHGGYLTPEDCYQILDLYGISVAKTQYFPLKSNFSEIKLGFPIVAKIDHPDIVHKSDVGGVQLGIKSQEELLTLKKEWREKFPGMCGILCQEQIEGDFEFILGSSCDPVLGHSILFGLGGTLVEVIKDYAIGHVPLGVQDPENMLSQLKCKVLFDGFRGHDKIDKIEIKDLLMAVNQMIIQHPEISEFDINPLIFDKYRKKLMAVDTRIKLI